MYSVQVAAFNRRDQAQALHDALIQRGYDSRVWGSVAPFRVRVGRFATRAEADSLAARMERARVMSKGMVVEAEPES
jgi:cell division septation protein DedD